MQLNKLLYNILIYTLIFFITIVDIINVNALGTIINPNTISNPIFHLDIKDIDNDNNSVNDPLNNTSISNIIDKFGSNTGSQSIISKQPKYRINTINNNPSLLFDGVNDLIEIKDNLDINLGTGYTDKSFAIVIKTGNDITSLQNIYEQGVFNKGYAIQIKGSKIYVGAWNLIDWISPNKFKIIDLGIIETNKIYTIILTHNSSMSAYLNGNTGSTLNSVNTQTTHGQCIFDTSFGCSMYSTGGTIGLGAIKNDSIDLSNTGSINNFESNFFKGYIGEIISWNYKLLNFEVSGINNYFRDRWQIDYDNPIITLNSILSGSLLPGGNHNLSYQYNDGDGLGIDLGSANLILEKWDNTGSNWNNVSISGISSSTITSSGATYLINNLDSGKYKANLFISDTNGNQSSTGSIFYIDRPNFTISQTDIPIGYLSSSGATFSTEVSIIVKTLGAGFSVTLNKNISLDYSGEIINDWNGTDGFGYDKSPYTGNINLININENIASQTGVLNTSGEQNTYTYKIKLGAIKNEFQAGGDYIGSINIGVEYNY